ncbi:EAL domain-containing protein [Cohnella lubricantis]|uniref:EAL domain-containing protein n=1 Tax=Cohnella lubricantis TaxID=2163172 RepID=UPI001AE96716|nr:EAL domain-containing protein [Cohnella lubricantis]MBP2119987.1 EAL domain-containing protein (putative c-di-GMP-specific phosphodiesterase class I) [Cohnella lubricantis]
MARYHMRNRRHPLRDAGLLELASDDLGACELLESFAGEGSASPQGRVWSLRFEQYEPFLQLVNHLRRWMNEEQSRAVRCRITYEDSAGDAYEDEAAQRLEKNAEDGTYEAGLAADGWAPIGYLFANVGGDGIADLILNRRFTSYMQPIVQPSGQSIGYEFLLRPLPEHPPFRPAELFEKAREAGLHSYLDREARDSAIRLAARHVPQGVKKFVNFLPSSIYRPSSCLERTFGAIREHALDPADFVFEVVETEQLDDIRHLNDIFDAYRGEGIRLAMDDVGEKHATLAAMDRLKPEYVKLDRKWVTGCHADAGKQKYIDDALDRAARFHGVVLAEGVEQEEDWRYLAKAGVPLLQGYLFGRPSPVPLPASAFI